MYRPGEVHNICITNDCFILCIICICKSELTHKWYFSSQAALVEQIAKLVDEGKITGVSDVRDESDRSGVRIAIELKKGRFARYLLTVHQKTMQTIGVERFRRFNKNN